MKAAIGDQLYHIIERTVKRRLPKIGEDGKPVLDENEQPVLEMQPVVRKQLVSIGRDAQRVAEANLGITSSRQRRQHRMSRVRNAAVTWQLS